MCVYFPHAILIPVKSRFLNPAAQADTLNKIILIPHGKRNENEEINVEVRREEGCGSHPGPSHFLSFPPPRSLSAPIFSVDLIHLPTFPNWILTKPNLLTLGVFFLDRCLSQNATLIPLVTSQRATTPTRRPAPHPKSHMSPVTCVTLLSKAGEQPLQSVRLKLAANSGLTLLFRSAASCSFFLPDVSSACLQKASPCFHGLSQPLFSSFLFPALYLSIPPCPPPSHSHRLTSFFLHVRFFPSFLQILSHTHFYLPAWIILFFPLPLSISPHPPLKHILLLSLPLSLPFYSPSLLNLHLFLLKDNLPLSGQHFATAAVPS